MEVSSVNQDLFVNIKMSSFFNIRSTSFIVDAFADVVDVVVHCYHSFEPFFCSRSEQFAVVVDVHGTWIKAIETSVEGEFAGSGTCGIVGKFCKK